jgi:inner membrane protein
MEPITHFLTGACIGRAGLNRKTAYATWVAVLAAEAADIDILWGFAGPVEELKHHRGIAHTLVGAPVVAAVMVGVVGGIGVWLERRRARANPERAEREAERRRARGLPALHWGWLYLTALIAALSHILLDWTNNYGVRPFFPFNPRWYAGSFLFIAEPVLWGIFAIALVVPWLLGLTDREIGARKVAFRGTYWAIFALAGMGLLGCWRWAEHAQGLAMLNNTQVTTAPVSRMALEPYPVDPWRWHAILETPRYFQTAEVNTRTGSIDTDAQTDVLYKPTDTPEVEAAKHTFLGQVYLDWGRWAVVRDVGQEPAPGQEAPVLPPGRPWTTVEFTDLRFAYAFRRDASARPPATLSGWVYIVDHRDDAGEFMGGREQK